MEGKQQSRSVQLQLCQRNNQTRHGEILPFELKEIAFGSHRGREGEEKVWPYGLHSGDLHAEDLGSVSSSAYRLHQQSGLSYCLSLLLLSQRTEKIGQGK